MEQLANSILGLSPPSADVIVPINLRIPQALYETYKEVAKQYNLPLEEALANLAAQSIQKSLQESLNFQKMQPVMADMAKELGLDLSKLTDGIKQMEQLAEQFKQLELEIK